MNLVLHNKAAGEIRAGNTFSAPRYFEEDSDDEVLKRFDFAVANPPFSLKTGRMVLRIMAALMAMATDRLKRTATLRGCSIF